MRAGLAALIRRLFARHLAGLASTGLALALALLAAAPAMAADPPPPLPQGRLAVISSSPQGGLLFLALDETRSDGAMREVVMVATVDPPSVVGGTVTAFMVLHARIDCARRTGTVLIGAAYDGQLHMTAGGFAWGPEPITDVSPFRFAENVVCKGLAPGEVVTGPAGAMEATRRFIAKSKGEQTS